MDISGITAAVTSLRIAHDIGKGLMSLHTMAEVQAKAIELNGKIFDAQNALFEANATQSDLIKRVAELEKEIAKIRNWDAEKQRYKLVTAYHGVTAYALQKSMSDGQPPHYICANCYQNGKLAILAQTTNKDGYVGIVCAVCKFIAQTRFHSAGAAKYAEDLAPKT